MSYQAVAKVLAAQFPDMPAGPTRRDGVGRQVLKLVAVTLAEQADADGAGARPGLRRIAWHASTTILTARLALDALTELGAVVLAAPSDGRRPDRYDLRYDTLAALGTTRPSARAAHTLPMRRARALASEPLARHRASRSRESIYPLYPPATEPVLRLAAEAPTDLALQRVAAILNEAARYAMNPDMFGTRYREHLADERVAQVLDDHHQEHAQ